MSEEYKKMNLENYSFKTVVVLDSDEENEVKHSISIQDTLLNFLTHIQKSIHFEKRYMDRSHMGRIQENQSGELFL